MPDPGGEIAVIDVAEPTVTPVAALPPKATVSPAAKPVPVIVTPVPPAAAPRGGETALTAGAAGATRSMSRSPGKSSWMFTPPELSISATYRCVIADDLDTVAVKVEPEPSARRSPRVEASTMDIP